jgi:hypothetical protein
VVPQHLVLAGRWLEAGVQAMKGTERSVVQAHHTDPLFQEPLVHYHLCEGSVPLLFTDNETNHARIFGTANRSPMARTASTTASSTGRGAR